MSNLSSIGNLMDLSMDSIKPSEGLNASEFLITASAQTLNRFGGRNWVPVIVKEIGEDQYEVIGNSFIYAVAEKAGLERVWCIIADSSDETTELAKVLSGEVTPKISLSTATREEIMAALQYLIGKPNSELKSVKLLVATNRIEEDSSRKYWTALDPITKLGCGITKGKLKALEEVFYLTPQAPVPHDILGVDLAVESTNKAAVAASKATGSKTLGKLTVKELRELARERGIAGYSSKKKADLVKLLS